MEQHASSSGGSAVPPRERLLQATLDALGELDAAALISAVGVRAIAARAGLSTSAVYHHFGSLRGLADAVVTEVFDPGPAPVAAAVQSMFDLTTEQFPLGPALALHASELQRLLDDPGYPLRMGLWAFGGPAATEAYRDYIRAVNAQIGHFLELLYRKWGREPRPSFDFYSLGAALDAVLNGTTLRQLVDPQPWRAEQFPRVSVAIGTTLTRMVGDRHDADARLAELNHYPLEVRRRGPGTDPRSLATRARVLYAATELMRTQGFEATTVAQLARRADVSVATVHHLFGSKAAIAVALVHQHAEETFEGDSGARPDGATPAGHLRARLVAVATVLQGRRALLAVYAQSLITADRSDHPRGDPLVAHVTRALSDVTPDTSGPPPGLAPTLLGVLVHQLALDPTATPEQCVQETMRLLAAVLPADAADG